MKRQTKIVILSVAVLFAATVCLWFINDSGINRTGGGAVINITENGEFFAEAGMEYVKGLESETIGATIRSSGNKPVDVEYKGVPLKLFLECLGINLDGRENVIVKGVDGYMALLSMEELEQKDIYIAYEMDGKALKPREQGGYGPFQLVIPGDPFSQRWCKYVCEVEVK